MSQNIIRTDHPGVLRLKKKNSRTPDMSVFKVPSLSFGIPHYQPTIPVIEVDFIESDIEPKNSNGYVHESVQKKLEFGQPQSYLNDVLVRWVRTCLNINLTQIDETQIIQGNALEQIVKNVFSGKNQNYQNAQFNPEEEFDSENPVKNFNNYVLPINHYLKHNYTLKNLQDDPNIFPFDMQLKIIMESEDFNEGNVSESEDEDDEFVSLVQNVIQGLLFLIINDRNQDFEYHQTKLLDFVLENESHTILEDFVNNGIYNQRYSNQAQIQDLRKKKIQLSKEKFKLELNQLNDERRSCMSIEKYEYEESVLTERNSQLSAKIRQSATTLSLNVLRRPHPVAKGEVSNYLLIDDLTGIKGKHVSRNCSDAKPTTQTIEKISPTKLNLYNNLCLRDDQNYRTERTYNQDNLLLDMKRMSFENHSTPRCNEFQPQCEIEYLLKVLTQSTNEEILNSTKNKILSQYHDKIDELEHFKNLNDQIRHQITKKDKSIKLLKTQLEVQLIKLKDENVYIKHLVQNQEKVFEQEMQQLKDQIINLNNNKHQGILTPESAKNQRILDEPKYEFTFKDQKYSQDPFKNDHSCDCKTTIKDLEANIIQQQVDFAKIKLDHNVEKKELKNQIKMLKKKFTDQKILLDMSVSYLENFKKQDQRRIDIQNMQNYQKEQKQKEVKKKEKDLQILKSKSDPTTDERKSSIVGSVFNKLYSKYKDQ